jgi:hypothetical protein
VRSEYSLHADTRVVALAQGVASDFPRRERLVRTTVRVLARSWCQIIKPSAGQKAHQEFPPQLPASKLKLMPTLYPETRDRLHCRKFGFEKSHSRSVLYNTSSAVVQVWSRSSGLTIHHRPAGRTGLSVRRSVQSTTENSVSSLLSQSLSSTYTLGEDRRRALASSKRGKLDERPARVRQHRRHRVPAVVRDRDEMVGQNGAGSRKGEGDEGSEAGEHVE